MAYSGVRLILVFALLGLSRSKEKCCEKEIGCFTNDYPFNHLPLPKCMNDLQPALINYRAGDLENGQVITQSTIPKNWDPNLRTIFLIHGFLQSNNAPWMKEMKRELLLKNDANVVTVDWRYGSRTVNYLQAASDIRTVGKVVANAANNLIENGGTNYEKLYCIGHSLGSHTCGHVGKDARLGRITGLDPAGPLFEIIEDWNVGLNPTRADLVDCIHTHGEASLVLNMGTLRPLGHIDFYPNGGGDQPGCILDPKKKRRRRSLPLNSTVILHKEFKVDDFVGIWMDEDGLPLPFGGADWMPVCSHLRVNPLYIESINTECSFKAPMRCNDAYNIPDSCYSCGDDCQVMGLDAEKFSSQGIFYLETNSREPFCRG